MGLDGWRAAAQHVDRPVIDQRHAAKRKDGACIALDVALSMAAVAVVDGDVRSCITLNRVHAMNFYLESDLQIVHRRGGVGENMQRASGPCAEYSVVIGDIDRGARVNFD